MKRLIFISSFDYPSRYAHAIHGLYMARAFYEKFGENFLFFVNTSKNEALAGIPHRLLFGRFGRRVKLLRLRRLLLPFMLTRFFTKDSAWSGSETLVFVNDPALIPTAVFLKKRFGCKFVFESHGSLTPGQKRLLTEHVERSIFLTSFLEREALARNPALTGRTRVIGNAVDMRAFAETPDDRVKLRKELSLPEGFLVGYVGRFEPMGTDKGLHLMIDAVRLLSPSVRLVLVGGASDEIARYTEYAAQQNASERIVFVSHVEPRKVPRYEKACDVLAYVPAERSVFYERETSPMKLYEYMAAERPIIVSDLPTSREVLTDAAAFFVPPGSKEAFIAAVESIVRDPSEAAERALVARQAVEANTWEHRAGRILEGLA